MLLSFAAVATVFPVIANGIAVPQASESSRVTSASVSYSAAKAAATGPVAGGSAVGEGLDTSLFTATTSYSHTFPVSTAIVEITSTNSATTYVKTSISTSTSSAATSLASGDYTDWTIYKANGVNLAGWFELETSNNPQIFAQHAPNATDEWTFCQLLGSQCGPVMENHYATFYTTADIDKLASVGVDTLRIPMTYAAWIVVPGSELYHGNQQTYLQTLTKYAIETYGMRVIIGLHSLPGGVNSLDIGEASGHNAWFQNSTNLAYSYDAVDSILTFIEASGNPWAFTISALNEASDNPSAFASPQTLTEAGKVWIVDYINEIVSRINTSTIPKIPVMLQDCFLGEESWSPYFADTTNLVIDSHIYYFAASGVYSEYVAPAICGQAAVAGGDLKFPVFVGEWSLQVMYNNSLSARQEIFNTQRYSWMKYISGGSFWSANFNGTTAVSGEGTQRDYWSYSNLIDAGVIEPIVVDATYC